MKINGFKFMVSKFVDDSAISSSGIGLLSRKPQVFIACRCGQTVSLVPSRGGNKAIDSISDNQAREQFNKLGWRVVKGKNKCPMCVGNKSFSVKS